MRPRLWRQLLVCGCCGSCFAAPFYRVHGWGGHVVTAFVTIAVPTWVFFFFRGWENRRRRGTDPAR